jgi:hypothetical protein
MKSLNGIFTLIFLITAGFPALAQERQLPLSADASSFRISGTSTLHDWHMEGNEASGFCLTKASGELTGGKVVLKAESLKSGKRGMDKNAYKALETDDFPEITFTLNALKQDGDGLFIASGELTVSGFTRAVDFNCNVSNVQGTITVEAQTSFLLTDFEIEPPTALLGTIKTGDEVSISIKAKFTNQK